MPFIEQLRECGRVTTQYSGVEAISAVSREDDESITVEEHRERRFFGGHRSVLAMMC